MTRPLKTKIDYFPHMTTHGVTMFTLEERFQNDGYALWFKLLETLCVSECYYMDLKDTAKKQWFLAKCHVTEEKGLSIINLLADLNAIDKDNWYNHQIVWVENLIKKLEPVFSRREGLPQPVNPLKRINANDNTPSKGLLSTETLLKGQNDNSNPTTELNEIKLNKTKLNEIKVNPSDDDFVKIVTSYQSHIGNINNGTADKLKDIANEYPLEWILLAFEKSNGKHSIRYPEVILEDWKVNGFEGKQKEPLRKTIYKELK